MSKHRSPVLGIVRTAACCEADLLSSPSMTTLHVGNLPFSATESGVRGLLEQHGQVLSVKIVSDRETGRPRGRPPEGGSRW